MFNRIKFFPQPNHSHLAYASSYPKSTGVSYFAIRCYHRIEEYEASSLCSALIAHQCAFNNSLLVRSKQWLQYYVIRPPTEKKSNLGLWALLVKEKQLVRPLLGVKNKASCETQWSQIAKSQVIKSALVTCKEENKDRKEKEHERQIIRKRDMVHKSQFAKNDYSHLSLHHKPVV